MNNQEQINQLIEAGDKATKGEWVWFDDYDFGASIDNKDWSTNNFEQGRINLRVENQQGQVIVGAWGEYADDLGLSIEKHDALFMQEAANTREAVKAMAAENERMREALEEMQYMHIGDQPAALNMSELDYAKRCNGKIRLLAKQALKGKDDE